MVFVFFSRHSRGVAIARFPCRTVADNRPDPAKSLKIYIMSYACASTHGYDDSSIVYVVVRAAKLATRFYTSAAKGRETKRRRWVRGIFEHENPWCDRKRTRHISTIPHLPGGVFSTLFFGGGPASVRVGHTYAGIFSYGDKIRIPTVILNFAWNERGLSDLQRCVVFFFSFFVSLLLV